MRICETLIFGKSRRLIASTLVEILYVDVTVVHPVKRKLKRLPKKRETLKAWAGCHDVCVVVKQNLINSTFFTWSESTLNSWEPACCPARPDSLCQGLCHTRP